MHKESKGKEEALSYLHTILTPGDRVYGIVRYVSRSGMRRVIDFYVFRENAPFCLSSAIGTILKLKRHSLYEGVQVDGSGMNMVFACVYEMGIHMFPQGFTPPAGYSRNGTCQTHEPDGGYAFKAEIL